MTSENKNAPENRSNKFAKHPPIADKLELCRLESGDILVHADEQISHVYFPETAVVSLVVPMERERFVEVTVVGLEGMIGVPVALDDRQHLRAIVQIPGQAFRMTTEAFRAALAEDEELDLLIRRYTLARIQQISQSVACNQVHSVQQRICRWLLMCHDRVASDEFPLTHQFLAQMLCVRRPTVSNVAARLQLDGLISYKRGRILIRDRRLLAERACSCYETVQRETRRLMGDLAH